MFDLIIKIEIEIERSFGTDRKKRNGTVSFHIQSDAPERKIRCGVSGRFRVAVSCLTKLKRWQ